ncbi:MAG: Hpt domain-containing protein [Hyphomicrobiaceae bacterium]|nr:Hpt domain-containing protein [Hyphomicrobiaceae bacterium]
MLHGEASLERELERPEKSERGPVAGPAAIDLVHLRRYTMGDEALLDEVLGLFAAQLDATIERLVGAETQRDWHMAAHTLKGSARAVGAFGLGEAAEAAEQMWLAGAEPPCAEARHRIAVRIAADVRRVRAFIGGSRTVGTDLI